MLRGCDVSGWNTVTQNDGYDFTIIKATEGVGWKSDMLDNWIKDVCGSLSPNPHVRYGFYHYARPETGNSAAAEANWFLKTIEPHIGYAALALDWEGDALNVHPTWALQFLEAIYTSTGTRPLLYTSAGEAKKTVYQPIASVGFPLWLADWSKTASPGQWKDYTIWQTGTENNVDVDVCEASIWTSIAPKYQGDADGKWRILSQNENTITLTDGNLKIQLEAPSA